MRYRTKVDRPVTDEPSIRLLLDDLVDLMDRTPPEERRRALWDYFHTKEDNENETR